MVYTYKEWMTMKGAVHPYDGDENSSLAEKITELLDENGYKNDWGNPNIEYHITGDLANVVVAPVAGALVHVTISRPDKDEDEDEIVRIHPDECFYTENYVLCDRQTRLAHAVLNVVNKVYGKEGE